jgi:hypothetical protein
MGLFSNFWARSRPCPLVVIDTSNDAEIWTSVSLLSSSQATVSGPARHQGWDSDGGMGVPTLDLYELSNHLATQRKRGLMRMLKSCCEGDFPGSGIPYWLSGGGSL